MGAGWAVFKPLILMVVFTFAFNRVGNIEGGENIPYPIFAYAGLMFWTFFSQTVTQVATSFVTFEGIIKKIYFPRIILPISIVATGVVDFFFSLLVYAFLMVYYQISPSLTGVILFLPLLFLTSVASLGIGMIGAAINVKYRDVAQVLPFLIQAMLFLTPVIYPVTRVPENLQWIVFLNPIAGVVDTVQAAFLGTKPIQWGFLLISSVSTLIIMLFAAIYFRKKEREFADVL